MLKSPASAVRLLVALHVAAGLAVTPCVEHLDGDAVVVAFFAIIFAQAGLLGILAGLGMQPLPVRLVEAAVGLLYSFGLVCWGDVYEWAILCGLLATSTSVAAGVLGMLRRRGVGLRALVAGESTRLDEPLRFGIRHLMAWIFATAVLLRIGQILDHNGDLGILFSYGLSFSVVSVAATWAALGGKRPLIRCAIVVLAAGLLGVAGPLYQQWFSTDRLLFFASATALDALILLASLALLRRTGLRLVRGENTRPVTGVS